MNTLPADTIVRAKQADILEVTRRYVGDLKRISTTEWEGPCPACRDGIDRFRANTRKQVWCCRQCDQGGDVIDLVMSAESVTFAEAIKLLTGANWEPTPKAKTVPKKDRPDGDNLRLAVTVWKDALPLSDEAEAYLAQRGIDIGSVPELGGLRWHPRCLWGKGATAPCIVARFTDPATTRIPLLTARRFRLPANT